MFTKVYNKIKKLKTENRALCQINEDLKKENQLLKRKVSELCGD